MLHAQSTAKVMGESQLGHHPTPGASASDSLCTSHTRSRFKPSAREMLNLIVKNQPYLPFKTMGAKGEYSAPY